MNDSILSRSGTWYRTYATSSPLGIATISSRVDASDPAGAASGHVDDLARHVGGFIGGDERDRCGELLGLSHALHGRVLHVAGDHLLAPGDLLLGLRQRPARNRAHADIDAAGGDAVDADAVLDELEGKAHGDRMDAALGRRVRDAVDRARR